MARSEKERARILISQVLFMGELRAIHVPKIKLISIRINYEIFALGKIHSLA